MKKLLSEEQKEKARLYAKLYRKINKEKVNNYNRIYNKNKLDKTNENKRLKEYYKNNPNKRKESQRKYYLANKEKCNLQSKNYRKVNKIKINKKANQTAKIRKINDPIYKLKCNLRRNLCKIFKENKYIKNSKTHEILGCSFQEFKQYLESKFQYWMNWDNHGLYNGELNYGWDIDHIIPLKTAKTEEELLKLNHYTNLQPLCSYVNRYIKKDNY